MLGGVTASGRVDGLGRTRTRVVAVLGMVGPNCARADQRPACVALHGTPRLMRCRAKANQWWPTFCVGLIEPRCVCVAAVAPTPGLASLTGRSICPVLPTFTHGRPDTSMPCLLYTS